MLSSAPDRMSARSGETSEPPASTEAAEPPGAPGFELLHGEAPGALELAAAP